MFIRKVLFLALSFLMLIGCNNQEQENRSPADQQIQEYSQKLEDCKDNAAKKIAEVKRQPEQPIVIQKEYVRSFDVAPDDIILGHPQAKTVVVEYFSPTCPHCVIYHKKIFPEIKKAFIDTGKIAYVIREFIGNKQDLDATILARCEGSIAKYNDFISVILEQQDNWAFSKNYREILTNIGSLGGIGPERYAACLNDEEKTKILLDNTKLAAKEPSFVGTPAFFINGKQYNKPYTFEDLSNAIENSIANN